MDFSPSKIMKEGIKPLYRQENLKSLLHQNIPLKIVPNYKDLIIQRNSMGLQQQSQLFSGLGPFSSKASAISLSISAIK